LEGKELREKTQSIIKCSVAHTNMCGGWLGARYSLTEKKENRKAEPERGLPSGDKCEVRKLWSAGVKKEGKKRLERPLVQ